MMSSVLSPFRDRRVGLEAEHAAQPLTRELVATFGARARISQPQRSHVDVADHGRTLAVERFVGGAVGNIDVHEDPTHQRCRGCRALALAGCSSDDRASIATDLQTAASDVANAAGDVANNAAEALARNIATQQGEEQFKNAGQELDGPLVCAPRCRTACRRSTSRAPVRPRVAEQQR